MDINYKLQYTNNGHYSSTFSGSFPIILKIISLSSSSSYLYRAT